MVPRATIDEFLAQKTLALAGVSRNGKGFGNVIRKELTRRGYLLHLIHNAVDSIDGQQCSHNLKDIAGKVGGLVLVTPPTVTTQLVKDAAEAGFRRVWMQQGAESEEAIRFCHDHGIAAVHGQCILMFAEPTGFPHTFHRWLKGVFGRMPK